MHAPHGHFVPPLAGAIGGDTVNLTVASSKAFLVDTVASTVQHLSKQGDEVE